MTRLDGAGGMRGRRSAERSRSECEGAFACAAPAGPGCQPDSRAASGPALGALRPLCEELADSPGSSRGQARPGAGRMPKAFARAAAERREARRWAIPPVISGDPEIGPAARRATGAAFRTSACRRSAPLIFRRGAPNWEWSAHLQCGGRRRTHAQTKSHETAAPERPARDSG